MRYRPALIFALLLPLSPVAAQQVSSLPGEDRRIDVALQPVFTLGHVDGPAWAQFQSLKDAAFDADGRLFLLDAAGPTVVAVSDQGALLFTVGRRGDGPGEYRAPQSVDVLPDGRLAVFDAAKRAFLLYAADGTHLEEVRPDFAEGVPGAPMEVLADGSVLALPERLTTGVHGAAMLTGRGIRSLDGEIPLLRVPLRNGEAARVAARLPTAPRLGEATSLHRAFAPEVSFGLLGGDRVAVLAGEEYRIEILTDAGTPQDVLERPLPLRTTSARDRAAYLRTLDGESGQRRSLGQGQAPLSRRRGPEPWFYPVVPPVHSIRTDGAERIWVLRRDPDDATVTGPTDLLSADGGYVGTMPTHPGGLPVAFGPGGLVVFFEVGSFDEPIAVVGRLPAVVR